MDADAIVRAVSTVPGVAAARLDDDRVPGAESAASVLATLQVTLNPGADEGDVAAAVDQMVRERFGVGVDPRRIDVLHGEQAAPRLRAVPTPLPALEPTPMHASAPPPEPPVEHEPATRQGLPAAGPWPPVPFVPAAAPQGPPSAAATAFATPLGTPSPAGQPTVAALQGPGPDVAIAAAEAPDETAPVETVALAILRPRLAIDRMQVTSSSLSVSATVWLSHDRDEYAGTASGPTTPAGVQRAVVAATVGAVQGAVDAAYLRHGGEEVRLDPEAVELTGIGASRVAVVQVSLSSAAGHQRLTGAAEVHDDVRQALVRATLDALNRRLETLLDPR